MKRGLISWDKSALPEAEMATRLNAMHQLLTDRGLDVLVVYTDVWRSNDVRFVSNYMPYWNRALTVIPRGGRPILLCALSPRVYPWIKTVTVHEQILPSPNLTAQLTKLGAEHSWHKVGVLDFKGLPQDLYSQLENCGLDIQDVPRNAVRPAPGTVETALHAHGAHLVRKVLDAEMKQPFAGLSDHQLTGRLERLLRRAGAEDLVILTADGKRAPAPAAGRPVARSTSVVVALEYNGHWCKVARNFAGATTALPPKGDIKVHRELLSGPYAWESIERTEQAHDAVVAVLVELEQDGARLFYGDTCFQSSGGARVL